MRDELLVFPRHAVGGTAITANRLVGTMDFSIMRNIGVAKYPLYLNVHVQTAMATASGSAYLSLTSHSAAPTTSTMGDIIMRVAPNITTGSTLWVAGSRHVFPVPYSDNWDRYLGLFLIHAANYDDLVINCWLDITPGSADAHKYADAVN